jgi:uncharacterized protein (TIGR02145 family)
MKTLKLFIITFILTSGFTLKAQVIINTNGSSADPSAMLDVKSADKGVLMPRLTQTQIEAIANPADGLMVYNTDDCKFYVYRDCSTNWMEVADGPSTILPPFPCGNTLVDSRDGQSYATVQIGTQCWMAENLNIGMLISGGSDQTNNGIIEKYCYSGTVSYCDSYGGLYQWNEMMAYQITPGSQGICPTGWHIPADDEWCTLENFVDAGTISCSATGFRGIDAGLNLKGVGFFNGNDLYGFNLGAAGFRSSSNGSYYDVYNHTYMWTSNVAYLRHFSKDSDQINRYSTGSVLNAFSVRCIND